MPEDYALTRPLLRDWKTVDQGIADHVADPDPHEQYTLETAALSAFAFAAYGGLRYFGDIYTAIPTIGAGWADIDFMANSTVTPRHCTVDDVNSRLAVDTPGIFMLSAAFSFNHNSSNGGRITRVRLYNYTAGVAAGSGFQLGTGRNAEATATGVSVLFDLAVDDVGAHLGLQIGGGDSYSGVEFTSAAFSINSVGEYRGELPGAG